MRDDVTIKAVVACVISAADVAAVGGRFCKTAVVARADAAPAATMGAVAAAAAPGAAAERAARRWVGRAVAIERFVVEPLNCRSTAQWDEPWRWSGAWQGNRAGK